jgi:protein SCO1/2
MRTLLALLALSLALVACGDKGASASKVVFANTDITGLDYGKGFSLTDHTGTPRTLADFKGKVVLVFFGFTQCPDVCPTTLTEMAGVMKQLGADADRLQVLFITVDPERDTPALLASYVPAFHPGFLGLVGDRAATDKVIKEFKLFVEKVPSKDGKTYSIDHTAGSYVFDPQGRLRLFVRHGQGAEPVLRDVRALLAGG